MGASHVLAHQWLSSMGHKIEYDNNMSLGWERRDGIIAINPIIYCQQYLEAFSANGRIWKYESMFSEDQLERVKERLIRKYTNQKLCPFVG